MTLANTAQRRPAIAVCRTDHEKLTRLAEAWSARNPAVSEELLGELDRARVVADSRMRDDVIRMGSTVRYLTDSGDDRTVTLVYPAEADISSGKVSILTPIGAALIGLSPGQSIDWQTRDGRRHRLTIETVSPPEGDEPPGAA